MKRGDLITVAPRGGYGKPRPAVVIQSDRLSATTSVLICPLTSDVVESVTLRPIVEASPRSGLHARSQIMVEKVSVVERQKCGDTIGTLDAAILAQLDACLAFVTGLADDLS